MYTNNKRDDSIDAAMPSNRKNNHNKPFYGGSTNSIRNRNRK